MPKVHIGVGAAVLIVGGGLAPVAHAGQCRDPWVTQAVTQVQQRAPNGAGDNGECNTRLYGGGQWSSYADLLAKVKAVYPKPIRLDTAAPTLQSNLAKAPGAPSLPATYAPGPTPGAGIVSDHGGALTGVSQPQ